MVGCREYLKTMTAMLIATTIGSLSVFTIGTVARLIMDDLGLSYSLMGITISIQRIASTIAAPLVGYAIDCIGPFKVLGIAMLVSTLSSIMTPLSQGVWMLLATRAIAGAVFPAYWPSCTKIASLSIPKSKVGLATAVFESGSVVGVVLTYLLIPFIESWRVLFAAIAVASLVLSPLTLILLPKNTKTLYGTSREVRSYRTNRRVLVDRRLLKNTVIIFFAFLLALQPWAFYTSWLSTFITEKFAVELKDVWIPITAFLLIGMVFGIVSSTLSDRIGGLKGRRTLLSITLGITSIALLMLIIVEPGIQTWISLAISITSYRAFLPLAWTIINDTIPESLTGFISGVNALAGQISMMVTPLIIAYIREVSGSFNISIAVLSILTAISILLYLQLRPITIR